MKNFRWDKKYLYWGATAFCVVVASIAFFLLLDKWKSFLGGLGVIWKVLRPFAYGVVIAYLLNKVMALLERMVFSKLARAILPKNELLAWKASRMLSILASEVLAIAVVAGLLVIVLPQIFYSIVELVSKSSGYLEILIAWVEEFLDGNELLESVALKWVNSFSEYFLNWIKADVLPQISTLITGITGGVISIIKVVINLVLGVVISIYLLYNKETFCAQCKKITYCIAEPKTANRLVYEMGFVNKAFGDYVVGTIIDSLIVGIVNYVFMLIVGIPYAALVSIIIAVTNLIPMFGPFIGAIPSALLILLENPMQCLIFVIFTVILQQIDGNVLKPKIHSSRSGISGFWIMFAILFFGGIFGVWGMILGVPTMTVLYSVVRRLNNKRLRKKGLPCDTEEYKIIEKIDPETNTPVYKSAKPENVQAEDSGK